MTGWTSEAEEFLREWFDDKPVVSAHTSGSTGVPKEIMLLKRDMLSSAELTCRYFGISDKSLLHLPLSVSYIAGKMMIVRALLSGAELVIERPSNSPLAMSLERAVDLTAIVPSQVEGLMKSPMASGVRQAIIGGAAIPEHTEKMLAESGIECYSTYGMTETCSHVALRKLGSECYEAIGDVTFCTDSRGCLVINLPHLSIGQIVTNDIAELSDSRHFKWIGRWDNVINSGGIKIFPEKLEERLRDILSGMNYYITSRKSEKWGREVILIVEGNVDRNGIVECMRERLAPYEVPKEIISVPSILRTKSGKIIRTRFD